MWNYAVYGLEQILGATITELSWQVRIIWCQSSHLSCCIDESKKIEREETKEETLVGNRLFLQVSYIKPAVNLLKCRVELYVLFSQTEPWINFIKYANNEHEQYIVWMKEHYYALYHTK